MKGRGFKIFALLAILAMAFGVTGAASAAPRADPEPVKVDVCHQDGQSGNYSLVTVNINSVDDADGLNGHGDHEGDAWEAFIFDGVEYPGQGDMSNCDEEPPYETCSETVAVTGEWSDWSVDPQDESQLVRSRTITYVDSQDREVVCDTDTEYEYMDRPVCQYNPELYADDPECVPPADEASVTLQAFCGGGVNVTLANAALFIQFADQDPVKIEDSGQVDLDPGDYTAWAEADEGFEFPEGATTQWEFSIDRCSTPRHEPKTGPESALPIGAGIAFLGSIGLAIAGLRRIKKS